MKGDDRKRNPIRFTDRDVDLPVIRKTISIRSPKAVLLDNITVLLLAVLLAVSVVFIIWSDALDHTPTGFESQGVAHHIWHYTMMGSSALALIGMFGTFRFSLPMELVGKIVLTGCLILNLLAVLTEANTHGGDQPDGVRVALQFGVILVFLLRVYILIFRPQGVRNLATDEGLRP